MAVDLVELRFKGRRQNVYINRAGLHISIGDYCIVRADRGEDMGKVIHMDTLTDTVVLTGGVIEHNPFLADLIREHTDSPVKIPPHAQTTGALGAALYALDEL